MRPCFAITFTLLLFCVCTFGKAANGFAMGNSAMRPDTTKKDKPKHTNACTAIGNLTGTTCIGSTLSASVNTQLTDPIATVEWFTGNNVYILTQQSAPFQYTPPAAATYFVRITTKAGCVAYSNSVTISDLKVPLIKISTPSNIVCDDFPNPTFTGAPTYNGEHPNYQWKVNGNAVGPVVSEVNTPFKPTGLKKGDRVTCEMTSTDECITKPVVESDPIIIDDIPTENPFATVAMTTVKPCAGTAPTFEAYPVNTGNVTVYLWFVNGVGAGNGDQKTFTSANLKDGDKVSCKVISTAGVCQAYNWYMSDPVMVNFIPQVVPEISIAQTSTQEGASVTYLATIKNGGSAPVYQWQINELYVGDNSPTYTATKLLPGDVVSCTLISNADCTTTDEVKSTLTNTLTIPLKKETPNLFTPNDDGVNDTWPFPGTSADRNAKIMVYNRLGVQVFHTSAAGVAWDGKTNAGKPCPSGVYYYFVTLDNKQTRSGAVTIIR